MAEAVAVMDLSAYAKYFSPLYTDEVYFFMPTAGNPDSYGDVPVTYTRKPVVLGSVQPYSGSLAYQEYGMQVDCKKRIFLPQDTAVDVGWGVAFSADATEPELIVQWAPLHKTHRMVLVGTR